MYSQAGMQVNQAATMPSLSSTRATCVTQRPFAPIRSQCMGREFSRSRTSALKPQAKSKIHEFDLTQTDYRKTGMESEKVDGTVTRLWKFFFRPGEGYVDRYGFSVPMGPLDDVSLTRKMSIHA